MKTQIMLVSLIAIALIFAIMPLAFAEDNVSDENPDEIMIPLEDNSTLVEDNATAVLFEQNSNLSEENATLTEENANQTISEEEISINEELGVDNELISDLNDSNAAGLSQTNTGWKKFLLFLTFNKDKKINAELSLAKVYLAKANIALKHGDIEGFKIALAQYEKTLSNVMEKIQAMREDSSSEDLLIQAATKLAGIQGQINVHEQKIENLLNLLADANITDEQRSEINSSITEVQNIVSELNQLKTEKEDELKIKIMAVGNKTEAEVDALIGEIVAKNFTGVYAVSAQMRIMHAETILQKFTNFVNAGEEAGKNVSEIRAKLNISQHAIEEAWALYNAGDYKGAIQLIEPITNYERYMGILINKADKESNLSKKEQILEQITADKKEILQAQLEKKKEILQAQLEKKIDILEAQKEKKLEILDAQQEKKKAIIEAQLQKQKEILEMQRERQLAP